MKNKEGFRRLGIYDHAKRILGRIQENNAERDRRLKEIRANGIPDDEQVICSSCGHEKAIRHHWLDENQGYLFSKVICDGCKAHEMRMRLSALKEQCDIPEMFDCKTLEAYEVSRPEQQAAIDAATDFVKRWRGNWLAFVGKPGTGKGHLAIAIANAVLEEYSASGTAPSVPPVMYIKHIRLIRKIRSVYSSNELTETQVIEQLDAPALLIIDEIGLRDEMSAWERATLDDLIDSRYEQGKALIITSNLRAMDLFGLLGERIRSRFSERGRIIPFTWDDYRKGR